jgi:hypothetical protein
MGFQVCSIHGLRYQDYGECAQCLTERLAEESMRRQEELLREQVQLMRERANEERQRNAASQNQPGAGNITTANLSKELLKSILDDAVMENSYDKDGDLVVREQGGCFVILSENKDRIRLLAAYVFKPDVPYATRLEAANNINSKYILVRASVDGDGILYLDHDIMLNDGITKRAFATTVKHFCVIPHIAVQQHAANLVQ